MNGMLQRFGALRSSLWENRANDVTIAENLDGVYKEAAALFQTISEEKIAAITAVDDKYADQIAALDNYLATLAGVQVGA